MADEGGPLLGGGDMALDVEFGDSSADARGSAGGIQTGAKYFGKSGGLDTQTMIIMGVGVVAVLYILSRGKNK